MGKEGPTLDGGMTLEATYLEKERIHPKKRETQMYTIRSTQLHEDLLEAERLDFPVKSMP